METPTASLLRGGQQLRLQHGPIDIVLGCQADPAARRRVFELAFTRFKHVLDSLVNELPLLRRELGCASADANATVLPSGVIARRMWQSCAPYAQYQVTPMAAVAGAVADELLDSVRHVERVAKIWVNNGGDIALYLAADEQFACGIVDNVATGIPLGTVTLTASDNIGGIATSGCAGPGQGGRSFSLGIADSVTVLAVCAAAADVAATLIANTVDLPAHANIVRQPANTLNPDSDLQTRPVVMQVGDLTGIEIGQALARGEQFARQCLQQGLIAGAVLSLRGQRCMIGRSLAALNAEQAQTGEIAREMMA